MWTVCLCLHAERNISHTENNCSMYDDMIPRKNRNEDVSDLRYKKYIYTTVSTVAVAHSLHSMLRFTENQSFEKDKTKQPCQVRESATRYNSDWYCHEINVYFLFPLKVSRLIEKVNCPNDIGEEVWIDSTRAMMAKYNMVNWQQGFNQEVKHKSVVYYVSSMLNGQCFDLNPEDIIWTAEKREVHIMIALYTFF